MIRSTLQYELFCEQVRGMQRELPSLDASDDPVKRSLGRVVRASMEAMQREIDEFEASGKKLPGLKTPGQQSDEEDPIIRFGKYASRGMRLSQLFKQDAQYFEWVADQPWCKPGLKRAIEKKLQRTE